ncbi:hypothetical protein [Mesorhizobium sp. P5_C1]
MVAIPLASQHLVGKRRFRDFALDQHRDGRRTAFSTQGASHENTNRVPGAIALAPIAGATSADAFGDLSAAFYTDAAMKMMKSDADFKAAWDAMSTDKQGAMKKECNDAAPSKPHAEFCVKMHLLGGNS